MALPRWRPEPPLFLDRTEAGRALGEAVERLGELRRPIVLALPRGGVPVGLEVARALNAPLDVLIVRKLGLPAQPELAIGAIASGGVRVVNREVADPLGVTPDEIDAVARVEAAELARRERLYRGDVPLPDVEGRSVIVVDDGVATGSTMFAAVKALRQLRPHEVVVAVPVAPTDTCARLAREADRVVCLEQRDPFIAIGIWYRDFRQLDDEEVRALLEEGRAIGRE